MDPAIKLVCINDYEKAAIDILNHRKVKNYFAGGADEEITLRDNILAYQRRIIRPRVLVDVSKRNISTNILGKRISLPIGVSPVAMQKLAHPDGEIATAKAAEAMQTIFILSSLSSAKIEDVAQASPHGRHWMQINIFSNRNVTMNIVKRAESCGFEALVVSIDFPVIGKRRDVERLPINIPKNITLANFGEEMTNVMHLSDNHNFCEVDALVDDSITWNDIVWLKSFTSLPVFLKGIINPDDAVLAVKHGVDGIFVSNHGGRQLDGVTSTIDILPEVVKRVEGMCTIVVDGGVRMGSDIFKALALGADMVFAGRPFMWGLSVGGEKGVMNIFEIFKQELNTTLALAGIQSTDQITSECVGTRSEVQPMTSKL